MKKRLLALLGLPLVYAGVVVLALGYVTGLSRHHAILLAGLLLILAGTVTYVWKTRRQSRY